jgi:hypothetical protein
MGAALIVLALSAPASAELKFKPGEDPKFNWANFEELKKTDLKGETLTVLVRGAALTRSSSIGARIFPRGDRRRR